MKLRDQGCRHCHESTSGDCGWHGTIVVGDPKFTLNQTHTIERLLQSILDQLVRIDEHLSADRKNWS